MSQTDSTEISADALDHDNVVGPVGNFRWVICGLLFFATTINYIDRQVIAVLKPTLQSDLGWNEIDYSNVVFWFTCAYAGGYLFGGRLMDLIGLRVGYALAIGLWSIAASRVKPMAAFNRSLRVSRPSGSSFSRSPVPNKANARSSRSGE